MVFNQPNEVGVDLPALACHAMWQCMSQAPGLSGLKAIAIYPPAGSSTTSRRGGLVKLKVEKLAAGSNVVLLWASKTMSMPCQWRGCDTRVRVNIRHYQSEAVLFLRDEGPLTLDDASVRRERDCGLVRGFDNHEDIAGFEIVWWRGFYQSGRPPVNAGTGKTWTN